MFKLALITEDIELNVDRVHTYEQAVDHGDDFDQLYYDVKDTIRTSKDEPDKPVSDDTPDNTQKEDDVDESEDAAAIESFKELSNYNYVSISQEGILDNKYASGLVDSIKYIGELGITYGPGIIKHVLKSVVAITAKIIKSLFLGSIAIGKFAKRKVDNFKNYKRKVIKLRLAWDALKSSGVGKDKTEAVYSNEQYINMLQTNGKYDFNAGTANVLDLFTKFNLVLTNKVKANIAGTKIIIDSAIKGYSDKPNKFMVEDITFPGFSKGVVTGYAPENSFQESFVNSHILPGGARLICIAPVGALDDTEELRSAYTSSRMFIGMVANVSSVADRVAYVKPDVIDKYLDDLMQLCEIGINQEKTYDNIVRLKKSLNGSLKSYVGWLYETKEKISLRDSLVEYVAMKTTFIDNTFIAGSMSLQSYVLRHLNASTQYLKDTIKSYS